MAKNKQNFLKGKSIKFIILSARNGRECILDHRKGLGFWETLKAPRPPPSNTRTYGDRWPFSVWAPVKISTGSAPDSPVRSIYILFQDAIFVKTFIYKMLSITEHAKIPICFSP